jgi:phosphate-selective porin OprO/OprP
MRQRMLVNFAWAYGPVSLRAEYGVINQEFADGLPESDFDVTMWLAQATWLITGEEKTIDNRIKPKNNFQPLNGGWGAFEIAVRAASYEVGDEVQTAGIALVGATGNLETQEITVGLNWWWSSNVVWRLNYEMLSFDEEIANIKTGGEPSDEQDIFILRWQIDF